MTGRVAVIGTGFLGSSLVEHLRESGQRPKYTHRHHPVFPDSIQFDLFCQSMADILPSSEIEHIVLATKVEDGSNTQMLLAAMEKLFLGCRDKRVVYISTDAVFDGRKGMYSEADLPNPLTTYGINKKACEDMLMALVPNHCIIRPSYIFGYSCGHLDSRLRCAVEMIRNGSQFGRYVDMYKSPIEVNQLSRIVASATFSTITGVVHAGGKRRSVFDFYKDSLSALGEITSLLIPEWVPHNAPDDCLMDTSLDCRLLKSTFGESLTDGEAELSIHARNRC